jgi:phosphoserine phosphatase RsbU/P
MKLRFDIMTQAGDRLPVLNAAERWDSSGGHISTRLTIFSATERRRYERELIGARKAAEAANLEVKELHAKLQARLLDERETGALREQFIAVLGHDLRNPLSAIISGVALLKRVHLDKNAAQVLRRFCDLSPCKGSRVNRRPFKVRIGRRSADGRTAVDRLG